MKTSSKTIIVESYTETEYEKDTGLKTLLYAFLNNEPVIRCGMLFYPAKHTVGILSGGSKTILHEFVLESWAESKEGLKMKRQNFKKDIIERLEKITDEWTKAANGPNIDGWYGEGLCDCVDDVNELINEILNSL